MTKYVGEWIRRREDLRLITGRGKYTDDVRIPGLLHCKILRSPYAHAKIKSINTSQAEKLNGVRAVLTGKEAMLISKPWKAHGLPGATEFNHALAIDRVIFAGQGVAAVAALDRGTAEDALDKIDVDYEVLTPILEPEDALRPNAAKIHEEMVETEGNISYKYKLSAGDVAKAFAEADVTLSHKFDTNTQHVAPLEPTSCVASYDPSSSTLTVWMTGQGLFWSRASFATALGLPENRVRVIIQDVGGSFGSKSGVYPHYIAAALLSRKTGLPVKVTSDRREDMQATGHRYRHIRYSEIAAKNDGKLIGWREKVIVDTGAFFGTGATQLVKGSLELPGPYKIENVFIEGMCVYTNKTQGTSNRGFGHPQATFARERMIDMLSNKLGIDPYELRLRNLITEKDVPYRSCTGVLWDTPNFIPTLKMVANAINYDRRKAKGNDGIGVGFAISTKNTSGYLMTTPADYDSVMLRIEPDGSITLFTGAVPHGQGHETILSQLVAEGFGVDPYVVRVIHGDSEKVPFSFGTHASRTVATTAPATRLAVERLRDKMITMAAKKLGVETSRVELSEATFKDKINPKNVASFMDIVRMAYRNPDLLPTGMDHGLTIIATYETPLKEWFDENGRSQVAPTYDMSAHAVVVRVDRETGQVSVLDYAVAHDCGVAINPMIVEGQVHGGFAHGVGMGLYQEMIWDTEGQLLTSTFMDYQIPTSLEIPTPKVFHIESVSSILGGHRGVGEQGTIGPPAALANAVADAIAGEIDVLPLSPERVFKRANARAT